MATTATRKSRACPERSERASASKPETSFSRHQRKCTICHHADRQEIEQMFLHWFSSSSIHRRFLLKDRSSIYDHAHATGLYSRRRKNMRCALENIIERSDECPVSSNGIVRAIKAFCSLTDSGEWIEPSSRIVYASSTTPSAPVYPASDSVGSDSSRAQAYAEVPGTTVDGWNCRYGDVRSIVPSSSHATATDSVGPDLSRARARDRSYRAEGVRSTPPSSVSHVTTTDAPLAPQKNPPKTAAPEPLAAGHSFTQRDEGPLLSNRYNKLLETDATHTKQTTDSHSNRYK